MPSRSSTKATLALLTLSLLSGCASSTTSTALREPGFRATTIRRPALLVRVNVADDVGQRERARIPEDYQAAVVEGLDRLGILALDVAVAPSDRSRALDGIDRTSAITRAREAEAEHLVIVDERLYRGDLLHCKERGRRLVGPTTYWDAAL